MEKTFLIQTEVRLAEKSDLLIGPQMLKYGQPYYVLCETTKELVGVFILDSYTNSGVLKELFEANRIFVPTIPKDDFINYSLQQLDLKEISKYGHPTYKLTRATGTIQD